MPGLAPSGQMRGVQPLTAKKPSDLARSCTSVRLLDDSKPIRGSELAAHRLGHDLRVRSRSVLPDFAPGGLVATLLDPQGRRARLRPGHRVCLCSHRSSPPRPTLIPRGASVSVMLAERGGSRPRTSGHDTPDDGLPSPSPTERHAARAVPRRRRSPRLSSMGCIMGNALSSSPNTAAGTPETTPCTSCGLRRASTGSSTTCRLPTDALSTLRYANAPPIRSCRRTRGSLSDCRIRRQRLLDRPGNLPCRGQDVFLPRHQARGRTRQR